MGESYAILIHPTGDSTSSKNETLRKESCQTCGWPHARGGDFCQKCAGKSWREQQDCIDDFNRFMHGSANVAHIFGVGWVNLDSHDGRRFLDP